MELQWKRDKYDFYERVELPPVTCETMRESIVPDSCADIARIVDTTGEVCLTSRDWMADGRFSVGGTVEVSVLYIPEKGGGPCVLRCQLPFQYSGESQEGPLEHFHVRAALQSIDTRALNPRKVLTRVDLALHPSGCRKRGLELLGGPAQQEDSMQLLRQSSRVRVIAAVREKECAFGEELPLSAGQDGAAELLSVALRPRCGDSRLIGNKLVVKGVVFAQILYRREGGGIGLCQQELPFSQILEGGGLEESWECRCEAQLLAQSCTIGTEGGREDSHTLTLNAQLRLRATVWREEKLELVADLYSTAAPLKTWTEELTVLEEQPCQSRRVSARVLLETGVAVKSVAASRVRCGLVRQSAGGQPELPVTAHCLYVDENDMLHAVEWSLLLPCPTQLEEGCCVLGQADCRGEITASILPEGVELRFPVDCTLELWRTGRYLCVAGAEQTEEPEGKTLPSLVLRRLDAQESLWSVAKEHRTTCQAILAVNQLESEQQLPRNKLLLIPRVRA